MLSPARITLLVISPRPLITYTVPPQRTELLETVSAIRLVPASISAHSTTGAWIWPAAVSRVFSFVP